VHVVFLLYGAVRRSPPFKTSNGCRSPHIDRTPWRSHPPSEFASPHDGPAVNGICRIVSPLGRRPPCPPPLRRALARQKPPQMSSPRTSAGRTTGTIVDQFANIALPSIWPGASTCADFLPAHRLRAGATTEGRMPWELYELQQTIYTPSWTNTHPSEGFRSTNVPPADSHLWDRHFLGPVSFLATSTVHCCVLLCHVGRVLVSPGTVHSFTSSPYPVP